MYISTRPVCELDPFTNLIGSRGAYIPVKIAKSDTCGYIDFGHKYYLIQCKSVLDDDNFKNEIRIEGKKVHKQVGNQRSMEVNKDNTQVLLENKNK